MISIDDRLAEATPWLVDLAMHPAPLSPHRPRAEEHRERDLVVGETYDLHHPPCAYERTETTEYRAIAPLPPATTLGTR